MKHLYLLNAFLLYFIIGTRLMAQSCTVPPGSISLDGNVNVDNPSGNYYIADGNKWTGSFQNANSSVNLYIEQNGTYSGNSLGNFNSPNKLTIYSCGTLEYNTNINAPNYIFNIIDGDFIFSGSIDNLELNVSSNGNWTGGMVTIKAGAEITMCGTATFTNLEINNELSESFFNICNGGTVNAGDFYPHGILTNDGTINVTGILTSNKGAGVTFVNNGDVNVSTGDMIINGPGYINNGTITIPGTFNAQNGTFEGTNGCFVGSMFILDQNNPCDDVEQVSFNSIDGTSAPTVQLSNGNAFDPNTCSNYLGNNLCSSLPVDLVSFSYEEAKTRDHFRLVWEAAEIINFSHFEIEESRDGNDWEYRDAVLLEEGIKNEKTGFAEFESSEIEYIQNGRYYRLKMIDLDGSFEYSKFIYVKAETEREEYHYSIHPNPNKGDWLNIDTDFPEGTIFKIHDVNGRVISVHNIETNDWNGGIDISHLQKNAMYIISFVTESNAFSLKLLR